MQMRSTSPRSIFSISSFFRGAGSDPKADFGVFHPELMHQAGQTEKAERFQRADVQAALQFGILAQARRALWMVSRMLLAYSRKH